MSKFNISIDDEISINTNNLRDIKFRKVKDATFNMIISKIKPGEEVIQVGKIKCKGIVPLDIKFNKTISFYSEQHFSVNIISNVNVHNISIECDILDNTNEKPFKLKLKDIRECFEKYGEIYVRDDDSPKKDPGGEYHISEFDYEKRDFRYYRTQSYDDMIDLKIANGCSLEHSVIEKMISEKDIYSNMIRTSIFVCPINKQMFIKGVDRAIIDKNPNAYSLKLSYKNGVSIV